MKKKAGMISIFCLWVCFATDMQGQEVTGFDDKRCFVLAGKNGCDFSFPSKGDINYMSFSWDFTSLNDCIAFRTKQYTPANGSWAAEHCKVVITKDCQLCKSEKQKEEQQLANTSKPKTIEKPIAHGSISLCATQRENIDLLKNKQNALGKDDAATYSMLNSAMNQMQNVECGITLKNVDCKNKNCSFEWSTKDSHVDDAKAKASVNRFYSELKKEVKEEADKKAAKDAEKMALVKLGVAAAIVIADAIDAHSQSNQSNQQSSERFTKVDDDGDGKTDALVEKTTDGGQNLYMDTNGDGKADKVAHIDNKGKATYEKIPSDKQFSMGSNTSDKHKEGNLIAEIDVNSSNQATDAVKPRYDNIEEVNKIIEKRTSIADVANQYASDPNTASKYSKEAELDNFETGTFKCNKFVFDVLKQAGMNPKTPNGTFGFSPTTANQWGDPSFEVPGWRIVYKGEALLPGDVISEPSKYPAFPGHVGIYIGNGQTASASSIEDKVVINDWGIRPSEHIRVIRRYDPN